MVPTYRVTGDHLQEECLGKITPEKDLIPSYWMKLKQPETRVEVFQLQFQECGGLLQIQNTDLKCNNWLQICNSQRWLMYKTSHNFISTIIYSQVIRVNRIFCSRVLFWYYFKSFYSFTGNLQQFVVRIAH